MRAGASAAISKGERSTGKAGAQGVSLVWNVLVPGVLLLAVGTELATRLREARFSYLEGVFERSVPRPGATRLSRDENGVAPGRRESPESAFADPIGPYRSKTHPVEIARIGCRIVSSQTSRRNNSPAHETIFPLACRSPETLAH